MHVEVSSGKTAAWPLHASGSNRDDLAQTAGEEHEAKARIILEKVVVIRAEAHSS